MQTRPDFQAMARQLLAEGFDAGQTARYDSIFEAAKIAAVTLLCAKYGLPAQEMLKVLPHSRLLAGEADLLVARIEVSTAFVGYIHSAIEF